MDAAGGADRAGRTHLGAGRHPGSGRDGRRQLSPETALYHPAVDLQHPAGGPADPRHGRDSLLRDHLHHHQRRPADSTKIIPIRLYDIAFRFFDLGYAAAVGITMLVFSILVANAFTKLLKRRENAS
nr:hypothetical protein [Salinicola tamaricis]